MCFFPEISVNVYLQNFQVELVANYLSHAYNGIRIKKFKVTEIKLNSICTTSRSSTVYTSDTRSNYYKVTSIAK